MKALRVAAVLMVVHGVIEFSGLVALAVFGGRMSGSGFSPFAWDFLRDQAIPMAILGGVFGALRIVAAVGVRRNLLWGVALGLVMSVVTVVLMVFMLPSGLMDAALAAPTLVLLLTGWLGGRRAVEPDRVG